jgi:hypothetical protein
MDEIVNQFQQRYQQLRTMRDAGQLSPQQFITEVQKLRWQDSSSVVWWSINTEGVFLRFDGQKWIPAQPPQITPMPPAQAPAASSLPTQTPPKPRTAKSGCSSLVAASPILAIAPSRVGVVVESKFWSGEVRMNCPNCGKSNPRQSCTRSYLGRVLPFLVQSLGSEIARQNIGLLSLILAAVPFTISFLIVFNRVRRSAA